MKAAVVAKAGQAPQWSDFPETVTEARETVITVTAAALSPLARVRAAGQHYSGAESGGFVAGVDGVGRLDDGRRVYFAFPRSPYGSMAQRAPARLDLIAAIPDNLDDVSAAALGNPAMSSWAALLDRAHFQPGESVLVNGATGASGKLAVQIAKHLGARSVVATGRNAEQLSEARVRGADATILLTLPDDRLVDALYDAMLEYEISVVLDYLWGAPALQLLKAIVRNQTGNAAPRVRFVQIGAVAGAEIPLDASTLRASGVELLGSGLRSVSLAHLVGRIGEALTVARTAEFHVDTITRPIETVASSWNEPTGDFRLVFTLT